MTQPAPQPVPLQRNLLSSIGSALKRAAYTAAIGAAVFVGAYAVNRIGQNIYDHTWPKVMRPGYELVAKAKVSTSAEGRRVSLLYLNETGTQATIIRDHKGITPRWMPWRGEDTYDITLTNPLTEGEFASGEFEKRTPRIDRYRSDEGLSLGFACESGQSVRCKGLIRAQGIRVTETLDALLPHYWGRL